MAWTDEDKAKAIKAYTDAKPTPETSTEIIKEIAEEMDQSPNGVRMILMRAGVYQKVEPSSGKSKSTSSGGGEGTKRVSKEDSINALRVAIENAGGDVDDEVLDKLTGKAAVYLTSVINKIVEAK